LAQAISAEVPGPLPQCSSSVGAGFRTMGVLAGVAIQLTLSFTVAADEFTGYVVDNYCWDQPGHQGIDGSQLGTAPGTHALHCLWQVPACKALGYVLLEALSTPTSDGYTYAAKHQLDDIGDALVTEMGQAEQSRAGDRSFDEQVTITGTLVNNEIVVERVCITPSVSNTAGDTFCFTESTLSPTSTPPDGGDVSLTSASLRAASASVLALGSLSQLAST